ncbi:F-box/LRR-repeat protein 17-like isoform X2 [Schistocerca nitens]|uniref:F-box/LRR-repeat protein 17-like isoform X2 n=1 Tax=Schistocerca nitens TaxID=7011 RepID=UPI0021179D2F|nr:F-box/LRR-repeat protein 17-like isoform X2 [Schistocerca nitens]
MAEGRRKWGEPSTKVRRNSEMSEKSDSADEEGMHFHQLPDEVIVNIFSSLSFSDLVDIVQNVCVRWKRLAQDPLLWLDKEYVVTASPVKEWSCSGVVCTECVNSKFEGKDEEILRAAPTMPQLRTLTLMRNVKPYVLQKVCASFPNLTSLQIDSRQEMTYSLMKYVFEKCPRIQKLSLGSGLLSDVQYVQLLSSLQHLSSVTSLGLRPDLHGLGMRTTFSPTGFVKLRALANSCPQLQEVHIDSSCYTVFDLEYFLKVKRHILTSVTLPWMMEEVRETRPGCLTQLRRLQLPFASDLEDDTVLTISEGCPNLRELRLRFSLRITDRALAMINRLEHLEILELSGCQRLGGACMSFISQLPALHTLVLRALDDLSVLQPSLRKILDMKELRCLDIVHSSNIGAVPFREFPGRLKKLRELHVAYEGGNAFSELLRNMPRLKLITTFRLTHEYSTDNGRSFVRNFVA